MSDEFAICNNCSEENTLINIQAIHQQAFTKEENELVESFLFCLKCCKVQKKTATSYRHVEYHKEE